MSALGLRIIACCAMLLDHLGMVFGVQALRAVGRIAFPLFVYLIYNGYRHTSSKPRYALRLAVFAVLSQIPYSLFCYKMLFAAKGNVFVTLLVALLCIWATDELWRRKAVRMLAPVPLIAVLGMYYFGLLNSDYGAKGIVFAMTFWLFDGKAWWQRVLTAAGCLAAVFYSQLISVAAQLVLGHGLQIPAISRWQWMQLFSLLALPLIFLYNGQKGPAPKNKSLSKLMQLGFYLFYPVHMLLLFLIRLL